MDLLAAAGAETLNMVRMSHSQTRADLNNMYALDKLAGIDTFNKNRDTSFGAQLDESKRRAKVLDEAVVVVAPITALLTSGTNKSLLDKYLQ